MLDYLGWAATAVFVRRISAPALHALRRVQIIGAVMWMVYAVMMHAAPVFVANLLVLVAAAWTTTRSRGRTLRSLGRVSGAREVA
jgi:hypothetical protein